MTTTNREARRTKIVATVGPASAGEEQLGELIAAGVDVFRLNFSHGTHAEHGAVIDRIRRVADGRDIAVLQDLAGPKLRLDAPVEGEAGDVVPISLPPGVAAGDPVLLGDGALALEVVDEGHARLLTAGSVAEGKGINLPSSCLDLPALTDADARALEFGLRRGVDLVALSFVQGPEDLDVVRQAGIPVIAKIERAGALDRIEAIIDAADCIMVARGDLGVEIPFERVPLVQKRIIRMANERAKPVITATQMLLSMVHNRMPSRAEVADVANAALDGTDAVMLSEETAVGAHPAEAVRAMDRILAEVQPEIRPTDATARDAANVIAAAACEAADALGAAALIVLTRSGASARRVACRRPRVPILALATDEALRRRMAPLWGVHAVAVDADFSAEGIVGYRDAVIASGLVAAGDTVVVTGGWLAEDEGSTNLVHVATL